MNQELLYRYLRAETSSEENEQVLEWLDANPSQHQKELDDMRYIYFALESCQLPVVQRGHFAPLRKVAVYISGVAAVVALMLGANYWGGRTMLSEVSSRMTSMEVPNGQRINVLLEDGTQVWLNAGTRIDYPAIFSKHERRVRLSGEAMFCVTPNAQCPFIVETFASEIEVLGTKFNVIADEATSKFSTTLLSGVVKVVGGRDRETIYMRPDEIVTLIDGRLRRDVISDPVAMQWTEGVLSLKNLTFAELMSKFEKAYGVEIDVRCKIMPRLEIQSGKIRISDGIDHALRVVQLAADFQFTRDEQSNSIIIE